MTITDDRSYWRRKLGGLFRGPDPLPGTLADQTPEYARTQPPPLDGERHQLPPAATAGKWQPRPDPEIAATDVFIDPLAELFGRVGAPDAALVAAVNRPPVFATGAELGIIDMPLSRPGTPLSEVLRDHIAVLEAELADRTSERDDEARINAGLRETARLQQARIEGLEITVRAYGAAQAGQPAPVPHDRC
jgi:hypothetical protein